MSALGQKRTFPEFCAMSALPPKADIAEHCRHVRFVPKADILAALRYDQWCALEEAQVRGPSP